MCRCGHDKAVHKHYRRGTDCSQCECEKYRWTIRSSWGFLAPTPVGPGFGWGSRAIEVAFTPLGLIFWTGVWIGRIVGWPVRRLFQ